MGFQFEQHMLGLWDLCWDLKKIISWEMGLGPPPSRPSLRFYASGNFPQVIGDTVFHGQFFHRAGKLFHRKVSGNSMR